MYKELGGQSINEDANKKWVIIVINMILDRPAQVRYQRIVTLAASFNSIVVTQHELPEALEIIVKETHVVKKGWRTWSTVLHIAKGLRAERKDFYIHTQYSPNGAIAGYLCKRHTDCKWLYDLWDHPSLGWLGLRGPSRWIRQAMWLGLLRLMLPKADIWIIGMHPGIFAHLPAPSMACRLILARSGHINVGRSNISPCQNRSSKISTKIVYVGPVMPERGLREIKDWMVNYIGPAVELYIVGPQDKRRALEMVEEMVQICNENEKLTLHVLGELPHAKVIELLCEADIGLCPIDTKVINYRFAYPVKIMEYMSLGLVVVASQSHGTMELVSDNENGFIGNLSEGGFSFALTRAVKLCENPVLRDKMRASALKTAVEYKWEKINKKLIKKIHTSLK